MRVLKEGTTSERRTWGGCKGIDLPNHGVDTLASSPCSSFTSPSFFGKEGRKEGKKERRKEGLLKEGR
jgi:hypothetical protein